MVEDGIITETDKNLAIQYYLLFKKQLPLPFTTFG